MKAKNGSNDLYIKKRKFDILNIIYRAWLESEDIVDHNSRYDAYNKMIEILNDNQIQKFKKYVDLCNRCHMETELQLIQFVLDFINQVNNNTFEN